MRWSAFSALKTTDSSLAAAVPQNRHVVFWGIAVLGCALDLLTKQWVFQWRGMPGQSPVWWIWEPFIGIETALNPGALFGMGAGFGTGFAVLSVAAAVGVVVWLFWFRAARDWLLTIALGCVMGGIGGNLYDRLGPLARTRCSGSVSQRGPRLDPVSLPELHVAQLQHRRFPPGLRCMHAALARFAW